MIYHISFYKKCSQVTLRNQTREDHTGMRYMRTQDLTLSQEDKNLRYTLSSWIQTVVPVLFCSGGNSALMHFQGWIRSLIRAGTLSVLSGYGATVPDFVIISNSDKFASPCGLLNHSAEQTKHCLHLHKLVGKLVEIYFGIWTRWLK